MSNKELFDNIRELKEERKILATTRDEELAKYKQASRECDEAYEKMAFTRSEMVKARREKYAARGVANSATSKEYKQAWDDYSIAEQVYEDALNRYKAEDSNFRDAFAKKRIAGEIYNYFREQVKDLSERIAVLYRKVPKKKGKSPKITPPTTEAGE